MSIDPTLPQAGLERQRSQELSLRPGVPPAQVPGYEFERFLGQGAYGEVWVAIERNTGRRVAIKFYSHRGGLDWPLLSREVEKLAFLFGDRYVVQLIGVGWDADPPYYIMEYLDRGSLADRLQEGPLAAAEAVHLFRDVAVGLVHAHGKGVLHCDLKPANILLDQDGKPRLADFGQSRLSHEQVPALGTLFYMAPEQADMKAVPDARWDVYALGSLLFCMLTGTPPHRTADAAQSLEKAANLDDRLAAYRHLIRRSPPPLGHRKVAGVDRPLAEIIDRCVAADPRKRYLNVQSVLDALDARAVRQSRRPMMVVGTLGPILLLLVVALFAWQGSHMALRQFEIDLIAKELNNSQLAARRVADMASKEMLHRSDAVEQVAASSTLAAAIAKATEKPEMRSLLEQLSDPRRSEAELQQLRKQFRENPDRKALQQQVEMLIPAWMRPPKSEGTEAAYQVASWFFCDAHGVSTVRVPESTTIGKNYAWRSFFHGGKTDQPEDWRPTHGEHLEATSLSAVFQSHASHRWIVAVATPIFDSTDKKQFLGVVALTVYAARFVQLEGDADQVPVLIDLREGEHKGMILEHPVLDRYLRVNQKPPLIRLSLDDFPTTPAKAENYRDPAGKDPQGRDYDIHWLAELEPVRVGDREVGWGVIVQEAYDTKIGLPIERLRGGLIKIGLAAAGMVVLVLSGVWILAYRFLHASTPLKRPTVPGQPSESSATATTPTGTGRSEHGKAESRKR